LAASTRHPPPKAKKKRLLKRKRRRKKKRHPKARRFLCARSALRRQLPGRTGRALPASDRANHVAGSRDHRASQSQRSIIRNDLLLLFGNQKYQAVSTLEGKEALRAQALDTVRKVVADAGGKPKRVEAVYFTSFVMQ